MKNPFSIFDFLGYVFPGAFTLFSVFYFVKMNPLDFVDPMPIVDVAKTMKGWLKISEPIVSCSVFLLLSYIVGHLVAYVSSITIERFVIWWYGYPSEFLMQEKGGTWHFKNDWCSLNQNKPHHYKRQIAITYILRTLISLALLPIFIPTLLIKFLGLDGFFIKSLDPFLRDVIQKKRKTLFEQLALSTPMHYGKVDYHRVIYHYVYERSVNHRQKMDNYVALYDFLRSMTLIFVCIFMYILGYGIFSNCVMGSYFVWSIIGLLVVAYLFYMSFFKFYRRFTLEAFMCLVSTLEKK